LVPKNPSIAINGGPGTYRYNVVGESHCNANLRSILNAAGYTLADGGEHQTKALLLCEPGNSFDPNAVVVVVDDKKVGYIQGQDAKDLSPQLMALAEQGQVLSVDAEIGWSDPAIIGVRLDMEFD
jgi:hypothetical protein